MSFAYRRLKIGKAIFTGVNATPGTTIRHTAEITHLDERGIGHDYLVYSGRHKWVDWRPIFPELLRFLVADAAPAE